MKPKVVYINSYGLVSIYSVINDFDEVLDTLNKNKDTNLDDFITMISDMSYIGKIKLIEDSEYELSAKEYAEFYNVVFERKFI